MSKVYARYVVVGDSEDMVAFEEAMRHIDYCCTSGSSREVKIVVDGDGSADLRVYRDVPDSSDSIKIGDAPWKDNRLTFDSETFHKISSGHGMEFGEYGTVDISGNGKYFIGE